MKFLSFMLILTIISCNDGGSGSESKKDDLLEVKSRITNSSQNIYIFEGDDLCIDIGSGYYVTVYAQLYGSGDEFYTELIEDGLYSDENCNTLHSNGIHYKLVSKLQLTLDSSTKVTVDFDSETVTAKASSTSNMNSNGGVCGYTDWNPLDEKTTEGTNCETSNFGETFTWRDFSISSDLKTIKFLNEDDENITLIAQ